MRLKALVPASMRLLARACMGHCGASAVVDSAVEYKVYPSE
jgi:hypothetical protein